MLTSSGPRSPVTNTLIRQTLSGFSLVELMIGIVIMAIALAVAMPHYSQWIQNTHIRNATESIQHGLQRTRAEAVSRNIRVAFVLGGGPFWAISQVNDDNTLTEIESRPWGEISNNVRITTSPIPTGPALPPTTITFSNLGTIVANSPVSTTITQIDVDSSILAAADTRALRITMTAGGAVRMCDPNSSILSTDTRYCPP